jgi:hypothetical protein
MAHEQSELHQKIEQRQDRFAPELWLCRQTTGNLFLTGLTVGRRLRHFD